MTEAIEDRAGGTALPLPQARDPRFEAGDALRGWGALLIFLTHSAFEATLMARRNDFTPFGPVQYVLHSAEVALYMFFALSAYLLSRPFIASLLLDRPLPRLRSYAWRRARRILPAFWVITAIVLLRHKLLPDDFAGDAFSGSWQRVVAIFALLQNYFPSRTAFLVGQAWSIHVEEAFYAVLPLAALAILACLRRRRPSVRGILLGLLAVTILSLAFRYLTPERITYRRSPPAMLVAFTPGVALATIEVALRGRHLPVRLLERLAWVLVAGAVVCSVLYYYADPGAPAFSPRSPVNRALLAALAGTCITAAPLVWQWAGRRTWRPLRLRWVHWVGVRSYSFYLWHVAVIAELHREALDTGTPRGGLAVFLLVALPVTLVLTAVSYRWVEAPFIRRGRRHEPTAASAA